MFQTAAMFQRLQLVSSPVHHDKTITVGRQEQTRPQLPRWLTLDEAGASGTDLMSPRTL